MGWLEGLLKRGHQRVAPMEERNETHGGKMCQKVTNERPSLRQVVEEYGLKVPYMVEEDLPNTVEENVQSQARKGFLHSRLFRDRVEMKEGENVGKCQREGFLTQMGESFEEVVTGVESLRPVLLL